MPAGQEIACHFSQDCAMVTKILDFIHKHPNEKVVKPFFEYLDRFMRKKIRIFWYRKSQNPYFFTTKKAKLSRSPFFDTPGNDFGHLVYEIKTNIEAEN